MKARLPLLLSAAVLLATACEPPRQPEPYPPPRVIPPYVPDPRYVKNVPAPAPVAEVPIPEGQRLYAKSGCGGCHAKGAPFHEKLAGAQGKSEEKVAEWILNARAVKPDTIMPPYGQTLSMDQARTLARWVLEGGPDGAPKKSAAR